MSTTLWDGAIQRVLERIDDTARRLGERFPHWADTDTGDWTSTHDGDWTGGYYVGMHWLALNIAPAAQHPALEARAHKLAERLSARIASDTVFKSFPIYYGCSLGAMLGARPRLREIGLECARSLVAMYNPVLGLIPLGGQAEEGTHIGAGETSIDSMQTAPFLYWAAREANDPRMREIAFQHANRIVGLHLRADDSVIQSTSLDPSSGALVRHYTHKGYSDTSTWGRAQAWGMLFSTMSYLHDRSQSRWLESAQRAADWWIAHVSADHVAFWDFDDPAIPNTERDTAATAIATAALLRLAAIVPEAKGRTYRAFAEHMSSALVQRHLTPTHAGDRRTPGMLTNACFNKRADARAHDAGTNCEFIVGDYYFFESLLALAGIIDPTLI
jgi:unsaturated chondroitin disaccharide hydrolase